jgi:50S ribosomal subunit-associated GTPase HflX
VQDQ